MSDYDHDAAGYGAEPEVRRGKPPRYKSPRPDRRGQKIVTAYVDQKLYAKLVSLAERDELSLSQTLRNLIERA